MCSNPEKARYLKMLVEEIKAEIGKRKARKTEQAAPTTLPSWPGKELQPTFAEFRK